MTGVPTFFVTEIGDTYVKENFRKLKDFLSTESVFVGFRVFEVVFKAAETNRKLSHGLGFLPKDLIITSQIGAGTVTFNQALTTRDELVLSSTDACTVRFLAGTFQGG